MAIKYDIRNNEWISFPKMNLHRYGHSSCTMAGFVCVFGGKDKNNAYVNNIEILDMQTNISYGDP